MKNQTTSGSSTMQEWLSFKNILTEKSNADKSILKKTDKPDRLIYHLGRQFAK